MKILITGGAGFIGSNTAKRFGDDGWDITILDNLSRRGAANNLDWLRESLNFDLSRIDLRDSERVFELISKGQFDVVIHLAGQVAVTTSVLQPGLDFESNLVGTFNLLEAIRSGSPQTILLNASTNKVYGKLSRIPVREDETKYSLVDHPMGVNEQETLDFYSPYGCSKGAAEQYVIDYSRTYGMRCVNFRQSCIYGYRQFGNEDQGWAAWFLIRHLIGQPLTIFGNGKQVRDILFVSDLIDAYQLAIAKIDKVTGWSFNVGGGPGNSLSLLEYIDCLEQLTHRKVKYSFSDSRLGDQKVYISDVTRAREHLNWSPRTSINEGLNRLYDWIGSNLALFS